LRKLVETSHQGKVTTLRNQQISTDRTIRNLKPHIITVVMGKERILIDVAIAGDTDVIKKEAEKV
jgi:hypothetical protein